LSKIIVGQGLKYNKELINNKEREKLFSKKYQVLSKNTALYAEITKLNDFQQKKLITIDLNKYKKYNIENNLRNLDSIPLSSMSYGINSISLESSSELNFDKMEILKPENEDPICVDCKNTESIDTNEIYEKEKENIEIEKENIKEENENINELTKLIMTQNIFDGFWDENEETKKLIQILPKNKIMEIENKIKKLNKTEENKIKYTIIVLFYLEYKHKDKLDEFKLIINKANKFLMSHGIKYEDIINEHS
jgi:hypothetical protein